MKSTFPLLGWCKPAPVLGLMITLALMAGTIHSFLPNATAQVVEPPQASDIAIPKPVNEVPPKPTGLHIYVNDYANLLTPEDKTTLHDRLQALDEAGLAQVSVLILPNTDRDLSEFAPVIMNQWDIQHYKKRDGLLILVNAYRVQHNLSGNRIFVGTSYALESQLPDAMVGRVLDEQAIPEFEQGQASTGITKATLTLAQILSGDKELKAQYTEKQHDSTEFFIILLIVLFILFFGGRRGRGGFYLGGGGFGGGGFGGSSGGGFGGGFGGGGGSSGGGGAGR